SRRRHTKWPRDWSSDVCSSDLNRKASVLTPRAPKARVLFPEDRRTPAWPRGPPPTLAERSATRADTPVCSCIRPRIPVQASRRRSEERRVGKEGGGRRVGQHEA